MGTFGAKNIFRILSYGAFIFSTMRKYGACRATDSQNIFIHVELWCILKNEIQTAQKYKQSLGLISFDIAKVYDTTWRPRIIYKLNKILTKGNLLDFINNFLSTRTFQVKTSNILNGEWCSPRIYYFCDIIPNCHQ
ncbi:Reverse transcriptase domain-containing protein [Aphis craccivora]|uniref:Reverse transcriptase domain-containing protein n=1 Tax=Aphis craccivora TaxID=307492 RepID=A0A6G0Y5V9_APHCR|nr:Reverse transcriptase domain-containing protein [Aphis craccivora]